MRKFGCYRGIAARDAQITEAAPGTAARAARLIVGLAVIASAGLLYVWPLALLGKLGVPNFVLWPLAILTLWLGISHVVAAATAYRGCPEIGAIASLMLRRRVLTTCRPWEVLDALIDGQKRSGRADCAGAGSQN